MSKVKNYESLISRGSVNARGYVLQVMNKVLEELDASRLIERLMRIEGDSLVVGERSWNLSGIDNVYLVGAGKACNAMAQAVCGVLGARLSKGIISVKIAEPQDSYINTEVYIGGHPLPNEAGMEAAAKMLELSANATERDLFISVISGGSSALLTYPVEGITLEDEIAAQGMLLESGAKIVEINAVRRHISRTNGGRLAEAILASGAGLISLIISDAVGARPTLSPGVPATFYGTPCAPDQTTIQDARNTIANYALRDRLPTSIIDYLYDDFRVKETPKSLGDRITIFRICGVPDSCEIACRVAGEMGIPLLTLTTHLEGESREAGFFLASIAREIKNMKRPIKPPCLVVCSGETTTSIQSPPAGVGGPSQELTLGFSIGIRGIDGIACASIDTEGTDGTTVNAGGIVDGDTFKRLEGMGINPYEALRNHSTGNALDALSDAIYTSNTGTNVCDFNIMYIE